MTAATAVTSPAWILSVAVTTSTWTIAIRPVAMTTTTGSSRLDISRRGPAATTTATESLRIGMRGYTSAAATATAAISEVSAPGPLFNLDFMFILMIRF
ncbi:hypothetical protein ACHAWX_006507 [Stephanocyclus meneghinianus]